MMYFMGVNHNKNSVLDEAAYIKPGVWSEVLQPACLVKGKKVIFISTPAGRNWFFDLFMLGKNGKKGYRSFTAPTVQNPLIPKEEIEEAKNHNELVYRQEYLAEFMVDKLSVFKNVDECCYPEEITTNEREKGNEYVIGIDLAAKDDYTVAMVMDRNKKIVDLFRVNFTNYAFIKQGISDLYHKWQPVNGFIEVNHSPSVHEDLVVNYGCARLKPFITSPTSKPIIINDLIQAFEQKTISIPNLEWLKDECATYTYKYNKSTGKIIYNAREHFHDDGIMSMAITLAAFKTRNPTKRKFTWTKI